MKITDSIMYIGVTDRQIDLFEAQYPVPDGITYNSYAILDEKVAIMDTVDAAFTEEWLNNMEKALAGRLPDYLIVQHMEPDHSANIDVFMKKYPDAVVVSSARAFAMMKNAFGTDYSGRNLTVGEKDTLSLGKHTLTFVAAPMVHWPEVIVTYDSFDKVLFSADAFGTFGSGNTTAPWADEAARYYFGIVGKYGTQVQALLKKASELDIEIICSLHGPVLKENIGQYISLYETWSSYAVEKNGIVIAYTSIYGNTKKAVELLADKIKAKGEQEVVLYDLTRCDITAAVADAFRYGNLILATPTYNGDVFPPMKQFIDHLTGRNFQQRKIALIENGSWSPTATTVMLGMLEKCRHITYTDNFVKILSALNEDSLEQIEELAKEMSRV